MNRKNKLVAVILMLVLLITGCTSGFKKEKKEEAKEEQVIPVELGKVELGSIYNKALVSGRILSEKDGIVIPEVPGKVKAINVKVGDKVEKGDILFTIENEEIDNQIKSLEKALGDLKNKKSQLEKEMGAQESYSSKLADNTLDAPIVLAMEDEGGIDLPSMEDLPEAPSMEQVPQLPQIPEMDPSIIYELDAKINEVSSAYEQAKKAKEKLNVKSPGSGTVSLISIKEDGIAMNTEPSIIISDLDNMYVELSGTETLITKVKEGDRVSIEIPALSKEDLEGKVDFVSIMPDMKTGLYSIKISIEDSTLPLKPGMIAKVFFQLDKKENVIVLNPDWVIDKNGEYVVYLVEKDKAVERTVTLGMETGEMVEIVQGLKEGEEIITKGQNFVKDGDKVKILRGDD